MTSSADLSDGLTNNDQPQQISSDTGGPGTGASDNATRSRSPNQPMMKRAATTPLPTTTTSSAATSPRSSREPSPIRPPLKSGTLGASRLARSRKNSQDLSPQRGHNASNSAAGGVPSAAAIQRALSVTGAPQLHSPSTTEALIHAPQPQKASKGTSITGGVSRGAIPSRLKSPPISASPIRSSLYSPRRSEYAPFTPSIIVDRATPTSASSFEGEGEDSDMAIRSSLRSPTKASSGASILETVQESSLPVTSSDGQVSQLAHPLEDGDQGTTKEEHTTKDTLPRVSSQSIESGSESGGNRSTRATSDVKDGRKLSNSQSKSRTPALPQKKSISQLNPTKAKIASEGSVRHMTVETETVSSIPHVAVGGGVSERGPSGRTDAGGSLRLKPSSETIRPRKEKKRTARKAPSINSGTASSKADIFEAKVASAVDEANSSDSEETFVYESNPPEPLSARPQRYHSRTPSTASVASQLDPHGNRFRQDGHHSIIGKKSMKFANSANHVTHGDPSDNGRNGSGRSTGGNPSHHHHIGRYGRGNPGYTSLFDPDSPFPTPVKSLRTPGSHGSHGTRVSSRPSTPRTPHLVRPQNSSKMNAPISYDLEGEGADDERAPLIGSIRAGRTRNSRRPLTNHDNYENIKGNGLCKRISSCLVLGGVVGLLIASIIIGLVMCSEPLIEVHVKEIQNVLASEQELIFDLHVHAVNPNLVAIQVTKLGIDIFAKSKYVSSSYSGNGVQSLSHISDDNAESSDTVTDRRQGSTRLGLIPMQRSVGGGVDEGNDPIEDPEGDPQLKLLGRILEFDSPLIFEASPLRHQSLSSIGEVRLPRPGNQTKGVSAWWEKAIQHPFELRVRGPLYYSLPISSRLRTARINGSISVQPEASMEKYVDTQSIEPEPHAAPRITSTISIA